MSSSITLSEQATWWTSGLFYEKLMVHVLAAYNEQDPWDGELLDTLKVLPIAGDFAVHHYDQEIGSVLARMIYTVAKGTRDGVLQTSPVLNGSGVDRRTEYLEALDRLVTMFEIDGRYIERL